MKNSELVSRVRNGLNSINKDSRIPKRYILRLATDKAIFFMAQKFRDRSLFKESNIFRTVPCFEMKKIDKVNCDIVEFRTCNSVMRSVSKLPRVIFFKYGSSLKEVTNLDDGFEFKPTTISKFRRDKNRREFGPDSFFYIKDDYLYLPESEVKRVNLYLYTPNGYEADRANACAENKCLDPWDSEFICSDKLMDLVVTETIKEVSMRLQVPEDTNPNLDPNQKQKTTV